jgi:hypothetical protein
MTQVPPRTRQTFVVVLLVVGAALAGATTATAQSDRQPGLTSERVVLQGQTLTADMTLVPGDGAVVYAVTDDGLGAPVRELDVVNGSVLLATADLPAGEYAVVADDGTPVRFDDGVGMPLQNGSATSAAFRVVTVAGAEVDLPDDPQYPAGEPFVVSGDTAFVPGTDLRVGVRTTAGTETPFLASRTVAVDDEGRFAVRFDPATAPPGTQLELRVAHDGRMLATQTIVLDDEPTPTPSPSPSPSQTPTDEPTRTTVPVPGLGVGVGLLALVAATVLVRRHR